MIVTSFKTMLFIFFLISSSTVVGHAETSGRWKCNYSYSYDVFELSQSLMLNFNHGTNLYSITGIMTILPKGSAKSSLSYYSLVKYNLIEKKMHSETVKFEVLEADDPNGFFDQPTLDEMSEMNGSATLDLTASGDLSLKYDDGLIFVCKRP